MQPQHILIFGKGQLGTLYREYFSAKGVRIGVADVDIRNQNDVSRIVCETQPDLVINVAAKTNIDWCAKNREEAFAVNALGADNIAKAALEHNAFLLHISSGCIQESTSAEDVKTEEDVPNPICYYSWTKVWAENLVTDYMTRHGLRALVLRPRQLLSSALSPVNALVKFLTYTKFITTPNSCTVVEDLLWVTDELFKRDATGTFNVVNAGITTPYRIAELLKQHVKPEMEFTMMSKDALHAMTLARRVDAVLSTKKLNDLGIVLRPVEERLAEIMVQLKKNLATEQAKTVMAKTMEDTKKKILVSEPA